MITVTVVMLMLALAAVVGAVAVVLVEGNGRFVEAGQAQYKKGEIAAFNAAILAYGRSVRTYNIARNRLAKVSAANAAMLNTGVSCLVDDTEIRAMLAQQASQYKREARLQMLTCKLELNGYYDSPRQ